MLTALALGLAGPASAAQKCVAPPGTAAMEQYCETVPSASGERGRRPAIGRSFHSRPGADLGSRLPPPIRSPRASATRLRRSITGVPRGREAGQRQQEHEARSHRQGAARRPTLTANPLSAVASAAGTGAEVGGPLVYTLLALTLIVVGVAWTRFRRTGD